MGNYSDYRVLATKETAEDWSEVVPLNLLQLEILETLSKYDMKESLSNKCYIKWYSFKEDMKNLSEIFPDFFFLLERDVEIDEGVEEYIFKDGKLVNYHVRGLYDDERGYGLTYFELTNTTRVGGE